MDALFYGELAVSKVESYDYSLSQLPSHIEGLVIIYSSYIIHGPCTKYVVNSYACWIILDGSSFQHLVPHACLPCLRLFATLDWVVFVMNCLNETGNKGKVSCHTRKRVCISTASSKKLVKLSIHLTVFKS